MKNPRKIKIFVVDTNLLYLSLYELSLKKLGHSDILTFANGRDCINAIPSEKPDIIFLNSDLEDRKSSDVLREIKSIDPGIYIVMVIDEAKVKTDINTSNYGISNYIIKGQDEILKANEMVLKLEQKKNSPRKRLVRLFTL